MPVGPMAYLTSKIPPPLTYQVIPNVRFRWPVQKRGPGVRLMAVRQFQDQGANGQLVTSGSLGEYFHRLAIPVAGGEILQVEHAGRVPPQPLRDQTCRLVKYGPINCGQNTQTSHAVADADDIGRLLIAVLAQPILKG